MNVQNIVFTVDEGNPLINAAASGSAEIFRDLLSAGADIAKMSKKAFAASCRNDNLEVVQMLLDTALGSSFPYASTL